MGICSSCLGYGRRPSDSGPSDRSRLLDDANQTHYGSVNTPANGGRGVDVAEIRRQREALERICEVANRKLIHVSNPERTEDGSARASEYARMFNERFPALRAHPSRPPTAEATDASQGSQQGESSQHQESSPSSQADPEEDASAWLETIAKDAEPHWDHVEPAGKLTLQFK